MEVSVLIVRALVRIRSVLAANAELASRIDELARVVGHHGGKLAKHDTAIQHLLAEIRRLTQCDTYCTCTDSRRPNARSSDVTLRSSGFPLAESVR